MIDVVAFHGQGSSPARMRYDCGDPDWITRYADWQDWRHRELIGTPFIAVGYSLGGDHIAQLTRYPSVVKLRGIIVYESPILYADPAPVDCPVVSIWNAYKPRTRHRRRIKAHSIKAWDQASENTTHMVGRYRRHTKWIPRYPFIGQAWDQSLNPFLADWVRRV